MTTYKCAAACRQPFAIGVHRDAIVAAANAYSILEAPNVKRLAPDQTCNALIENLRWFHGLHF